MGYQPASGTADPGGPWLSTGPPEHNQNIASTAEIETPGLSLNGAPKAVSRGCGRRPQERLIGVIEAHY